MFTVTADTPRRDRNILGATISMPEPYAAGHQLDELEAAVMNQTLAENIRNNNAKAIKDTVVEVKVTDPETGEVSVVEQYKDGWSDERIQAEIIDPYVASYRWYARGERQRLDPETRLARDLCKQKVLEVAASKNRKLDKETLAAKVDETFEKHEAVFRKEALRILKSKVSVEVILD